MGKRLAEPGPLARVQARQCVCEIGLVVGFVAVFGFVKQDNLRREDRQTVRVLAESLLKRQPDRQVAAEAGVF